MLWSKIETEIILYVLFSILISFSPWNIKKNDKTFLSPNKTGKVFNNCKNVYLKNNFTCIQHDNDYQYLYSTWRSVVFA